MQNFFQIKAPSEFSFWSWNACWGFFGIAVTDLCIKWFEKGGEGVF